MIHKNTCSTQQKILGVGLICIDIIIRQGKSLRYYNGGSCGNVISALSFLGWDSDLITRRHEDIAGDILKINFDKIGVNHIEVGKKPSHTPRIIEKLTIKKGEYLGHDFLLKCPDCFQELPKLKLINTTEIKPIIQSLYRYGALYTDRISAGIRSLRDNFNQHGAWTIYEPNSFRNINAFLKNAKESTIVKFSSEKIPFEIANRLRSLADESKILIIVQTLGENGLRFCFRKRNKKLSSWINLPAQPITNLVDIAGAGDWCTAGTIINLLSIHPKSPNWLTENEVISALQYGQALSAISCSFVGGQGLIYADKNIDKITPAFEGIKMPSFKQIKPTNPRKTQLNKLCKTCLQYIS